MSFTFPETMDGTSTDETGLNIIGIKKRSHNMLLPKRFTR